MLIAMQKSPEDVILKNEETPKASKGEVQIKVISCGVCGGDLNPSENYRYFGHEMAGIVTEVGENVTRVKTGDRIVVESTGFCGHCNTCKDGRVDLCDNAIITSFKGFAQYAVVPENNCIILPEDISFKQAAILEPLGVAIDLVKTAEIKFGDHVLIYGTGSIGLMALSIAKHSGATKIYAVLRSHSKRKAEVALKLGADEIIYSDKTDLCGYDFAKKGVDKALITAHNSVIPQALNILNYGGTAAFLGFGGENNITIDANKFHVRKLSLKGSFAKPGIYLPLAMDLVRSKIIDTNKIITHTAPIEEISKLMYKIGVCKEESIKGVMLNA